MTPSSSASDRGQEALFSRVHWAGRPHYRERMGFESACSRSGTMRQPGEFALQLVGAVPAPQQDVGRSSAERREDKPTDWLAVDQQLGRDGKDSRRGRPALTGRRRRQVAGSCTQDSQRPVVDASGNRNCDVPSRHRPITDQATGCNDYVADARREDVEPVPIEILARRAQRRCGESLSRRIYCAERAGVSGHRLSVRMTETIFIGTTNIE